MMNAPPSASLLRPLGILHGTAAAQAIAAGLALPMPGGAFAAAEALFPQADAPASRQNLSLEMAAAHRTAAYLATPPAYWAGFALDRPLVMGIVNVTPDSFSDGGDHADAEAAIAHGRRLRAEGADILDIGGESTRPGAEPVSPAQELARVLPVIRALADEGAVISIDTRHAVVMREAIAAGARIINDVTGLTGDPESLAVAASTGAPVVLMHMRGEPRTMQQQPSYADVVVAVMAHLEGLVARALAAGIARDRIAIDPGIGFGKDVDHNVTLLDHTALFHGLGCPLLIGVSRKRFIAALSAGEAPKARLPGSLAAALHCLDQGAQILRVHDVAETVQAIALWRALNTR